MEEANYSTGDYYHYSYDAVGNRKIQEKLINNFLTTDSYTYDHANHLKFVNGVEYFWDDNGNLLNDGVNAYQYDAANRLTAFGPIGQTPISTYVYNGLGDRLQETINGQTITFTMDLNTGLTQALSDGTNNYIYGVGRIAQTHDTITEYFLDDALGSVRQLTNTTGVITYARKYDPYGVVTQTTGSAQTPYGYTGEYSNEYTSQGLIYLRSRMYDPASGRFTTKDLWQGDFIHPLSINKWNYVGSNPINRVDPSGLLYLTFDDGPQANDLITLDILRILGAKANFFFIGQDVDPNNPQSREIVWHVAAAGHRLGNHTYNHINISTECWDDVLQSVLDADYRIKETLSYVKSTEPSKYYALDAKTRDYIDGVIKNGTGLFRPPGGDITVNQEWLLEANYEGAPGTWDVVMWTVDPADWYIDDAGLPADMILDRIINGWCSNPVGCVLRGMKPNRFGSFGVQSNSDNILLHSDSEPTVEILPKLIEWIKSKGYTFDLLTPAWQR